jgi:hypothetical protein
MKRVVLPTLFAFAAGCDRTEHPPPAFFRGTIDSSEIVYQDCSDTPFEAVQGTNCISILLRCGDSGPGVVSSGGSRANIELSDTADRIYMLGRGGNRLEISTADGRAWATDYIRTGALTIRTGRYEEPVGGKYDEYLEGEFSAHLVEQRSSEPIPREKRVTGGRFHLRKRSM